jgi:hypothetical protein
MPWGAIQWLRLVKEASYGVRNPSPDPVSDILFLRLHQSNAFSGMRKTPQRQIIRTADAGNRRRQVVAARSVYAGSLATLLYPTQAPFLLDLAATLSGNDLTSFSVDYFDSVRIQSYVGCKIKKLSIPSTATTDYVPLMLDLVGQKLDPGFVTFPQPADTVFPTEVPYEHVETAGNVTVGSLLTLYSSLNLTIDNVLAGTWDELPYISRLYYCGRDVDFSFRAQYLTTDFRAALEAQTPLACSLGWVRTSPSHSAIFDLKATNYEASVADDIPLDNATYQTVSVQSFFDSTALTDLAVSAS